MVLLCFYYNGQFRLIIISANSYLSSSFNSVLFREPFAAVCALFWFTFMIVSAVRVATEVSYNPRKCIWTLPIKIFF
jgi:hypothetical protein